MFLEEILIRVQESKDTKLNIFFQKNRRKWVVLLGFNSTRCLMFRFARSFARTFSFYFPHTINTPSVKKKRNACEIFTSGSASDLSKTGGSACYQLLCPCTLCLSFCNLFGWFGTDQFCFPYRWVLLEEWWFIFQDAVFVYNSLSSTS